MMGRTGGLQGDDMQAHQNKSAGQRGTNTLPAPRRIAAWLLTMGTLVALGAYTTVYAQGSNAAPGAAGNTARPNGPDGMNPQGIAKPPSAGSGAAGVSNPNNPDAMPIKRPAGRQADDDMTRGHLPSDAIAR
jgi:hypothetical protein